MPGSEDFSEKQTNLIN